MKKNFLTPIVALSVAATTLLSSCTKEEYNLDDISDNIMFNTSLGAPIIAQRNISFIDFFDMEMEGQFAITESEATRITQKLRDAKHESPIWRPKCVQKDKNGEWVLVLSEMNGQDLEFLNQIDISFDEEMPSSEDFIEIDDLDETFGEGNAINEIDEVELKMEIENRSDFQILLSIAFAKTVKTFSPNGGFEEKHVPIEGTQATNGESHQIVIPARKRGENSTGMQTHTLTFNNIAKQIKDNHATGLIISYELSKGSLDSFTIKVDDGVSMSLKAFVRATIDLSNI